MNKCFEMYGIIEDYPLKQNTFKISNGYNTSPGLPCRALFLFILFLCQELAPLLFFLVVLSNEFRIYRFLCPSANGMPVPEISFGGSFRLQNLLV